MGTEQFREMIGRRSRSCRERISGITSVICNLYIAIIVDLPVWIIQWVVVDIVPDKDFILHIEIVDGFVLQLLCSVMLYIYIPETEEPEVGFAV